MRGEAKERGVNEYESVDDEHWPKAESSSKRNSKNDKPDEDIQGKGKIKWYDRLPYNDFVDDLPMLRYVRGARAKIHITTFDEINKSNQQIFECNKSFFRYRHNFHKLAPNPKKVHKYQELHMSKVLTALPCQKPPTKFDFLRQDCLFLRLLKTV